MDLLRVLPKIDKFITNNEFKGFNRKLLIKISRDVIENLRKDILAGKVAQVDEKKLIEEVKTTYNNLFKSSLKPLINATGIILHTNMGRSPISLKILNRASKVICNYSTLEYNQKEGCRGERYDHVCNYFKNLLDVEDVLIVNNNASAVFLILNSFAKNKEIVVSRGELVEIGGSFRIPEVMRQSGAILKEVGTTNKTKLSDYENAINNNTAMLMKVHKSNFSIEGFYEEVNYQDIKELCDKLGLIDYYDLGSGYIIELPYNLGKKEPSLIDILEQNPSLISFSGDKLFGSVQAGIILGKKELIQKLKKNQLLRMLRVDKITLSILEETLKAYLMEDYELIPTLWMLSQDIKFLRERAQTMQKAIGMEKCKVVETMTFMGGGTLPNRQFPSIALHIKGKATHLEKEFRNLDLIGRIENDMFLIDFRSILPEQDNQIIEIINKVLNK